PAERHTMTDLTVPDMTIRPVLAAAEPPSWNSAIWVGEIWLDIPGAIEPDRFHLRDADGYHRARLLVRSEAGPLGFVELDVVEQAIDGRQLRELVADLPRVDDSQSIVSAVPA
ncbi:hypothetical protein C6A85_72875, partial [Mycobacterium sp. ITM-2017-0098]